MDDPGAIPVRIGLNSGMVVLARMNGVDQRLLYSRAMRRDHEFMEVEGLNGRQVYVRPSAVDCLEINPEL